MPVIMGRKTYESLGKPLAGRTNIVITRQHHWQPEGVIVANSLDKSIEAAAGTDAKEAFIIGGGEIFKQALPMANRIFITRVHASFEGDAFFPEFRNSEWQQTSQLDFQADEKHAYAYSFQVWERKK